MHKPRPTQPIARRLEDIRRNSGARSLRAFWKKLNAESGRPEQERVSYEAARNYHYDRPAPVRYLEDVARVFGVRLQWLATGKGARTDAEESIPAAADPLVEAELEPDFRPLFDFARFSAGTRALFDDVWHRNVAAWEGGVPPAPQYSAVDAGFALLDLVQLPLELWGFRHPPQLSDRELNDFYSAMLHALALLQPLPGRGDPVDFRGVLVASGVTANYASDRADKLKAFAAQFEERKAFIANRDLELAAIAREMRALPSPLTEAQLEEYSSRISEVVLRDNQDRE